MKEWNIKHIICWYDTEVSRSMWDTPLHTWYHKKKNYIHTFMYRYSFRHLGNISIDTSTYVWKPAFLFSLQAVLFFFLQPFCTTFLWCFLHPAPVSSPLPSICRKKIIEKGNVRKTEHKKIIPPNLYEFSAFPSTAPLWFSTFNSRQTTLLKCARYLNAFFSPPTSQLFLIFCSTSVHCSQLFTSSDDFLCRIPISMHAHTPTHVSAAFSYHTFFFRTTQPSSHQSTYIILRTKLLLYF